MAGCFEGAPRNNPLDPRGDHFVDEGGLSVRVTNFYPPRSGLSGARIEIQPTGISGQTDAAGRFVVPGLPSGPHTLTVTRDGYARRDTTMNVDPGEMAQLDIPLPGLPAFTRFEVVSVHISRWFPPPEELFRVEVQAELDDPDGLADIDSIWVTIPDYGFSAPLSVQLDPGRYAHTIPENELPVGLKALYGHDFVLVARDRTGATNRSFARHLIRVIPATPLALTPQGLELLSDPQPTFTWEPVALEFPFTYRVDIVRVDQNIQNTVQVIEPIPGDSSSTRAPEPLSAGEYFWTVSIVDEFGNRSRSREAGFRIP